MRFVFTPLLTVIAFIAGYFTGDFGVVREQFRFLLHWWIILMLVGAGIGTAWAIGYGIYIRPRLQEILRRTEDLVHRENVLERKKNALMSSVEERSRTIKRKGSMILLDLTAEEEASALGKQIRHVEKTIYELYEDKMEMLEAENSRFYYLLHKDDDEPTTPYASKVKGPKNGDYKNLVEGPPVRRGKAPKKVSDSGNN